ncbi:unnamed protein product [Orchesella dallaii]|uniref:Uncharacterized protein n=1 Tax=Orchesella dallaii TaxID=48710 RepID=A0ABP1Q521_9HEXA
MQPEPITGKPNYPFIRPKDPNTIYYSRRQPNVELPCKIENADATISLHKHEGGKLSCPYPLDYSVSYDRFRGFILNTQASKDLDGRYVCVGDFNGELRLMKYTLIASEDFTNRYVEGEAQNIIALDSEKKSAATSSLLAQGDTLSNTFLSGLNIQNLTAAGFIDPRAEFETGVEDLFALEDEPTIIKPNSTTTNNKPPPQPVSTKSAKKP